MGLISTFYWVSDSFLDSKIVVLFSFSGTRVSRIYNAIFFIASNSSFKYLISIYCKSSVYWSIIPSIYKHVLYFAILSLFLLKTQMVANVSMDKECELQARTLFCNFTFGACKDTQMVAIVSMECELPPRCSNTSLTTFDALQAMLESISNFY